MHRLLRLRQRAALALAASTFVLCVPAAADAAAYATHDNCAGYRVASARVSRPAATKSASTARGVKRRPCSGPHLRRLCLCIDTAGRLLVVEDRNRSLLMLSPDAH
jgi:hypothetical protein